MTPDDLARLFHETYERRAPEFGYKTREASAVPWSDVPEPNRSLMVAVAGDVLETVEGERDRSLRRCAASLDDLIRSHDDPGVEALGALSEARGILGWGP